MRVSKSVVLVAAVMLVGCGSVDGQVVSDPAGSLATPTSNDVLVQSSAPDPPATQPPVRSPSADSDPLLGTEADVAVFYSLLTKFTAGDPQYPTNPADVYELFDLVFVGEVVGFSDGRREQLGIDPDTEEPFTARFVNVEVNVVETFQNRSLDGFQKVSVEFGWPRNLDIEKLMRATPVGVRVIVLAKPVDMDFVVATSRPLIEAGLLDTDAIANNLVVAAPYGFILESPDADSEYARNQERGFQFFAEGLNVEFDGFNGAIDLLRANAPR